MKSPFPYFGGKSRAASIIWDRFGDVQNYVEPFAGSLAVLLLRPHAPKTETVNDLDGMISNFWRAMKSDPKATAFHADNPVNENDLHARHAWLVGQKESLQAKLEGDPDYFDAKMAGWWVWGISCWIGSGFCSGNGPWQVQMVDGVNQLVRGQNGKIVRKRPHMATKGKGVNRQLVHLGNSGCGVAKNPESLPSYFAELSSRLLSVRVACGDWARVCGPSVTVAHGLTAVLLDSPYADTANRSEVYSVDSQSVAHDVRAWAIANGSNPLMRIALCGYDGEHEMPVDWECVAWKAHGGYGSQSQAGRGRDNSKRERIWFSSGCLKPEHGNLL